MSAMVHKPTDELIFVFSRSSTWEMSNDLFGNSLMGKKKKLKWVFIMPHVTEL